MHRLARRAQSFFGRVKLHDKPRAEPEPVFTERRPMNGLFAQLSQSQRQTALNYRGEEFHGALEFLQRRTCK